MIQDSAALSDASSPSTRNQARDRIVAAGTRLLREQGADAVTTRAVAAAAGVQAPAIYRLFGDKDGLLQAVAQHVFAAYVAGKATGEQTGDPVEDLREGWDTHMGFGLANPDLFAVLSAPHHGNPSPAAVAGSEILRRRLERVAAAGRLRVPVQRAVAMFHAAGTGTVLALLAVAPADRDAGLGDAIYESLMRTILTDEAAGPDEDATTAAAITLQSTLPGSSELTGAERALMAEWLQRIVDRDGRGTPSDATRP